MNIDALTLLSNAQVVAASGNSTNAYDSATNQGMLTGIGEAMECVISVGAVNTLTSCVCTLYADDDNNGTNKTTIGAVTIPSTAVAGNKFVIDIPASDDSTFTQSRPSNRFYYLTYTLTGTSITLTAWITPDDMVQNDHVYPKSGYTVK